MFFAGGKGSGPLRVLAYSLLFSSSWPVTDIELLLLFWIWRDLRKASIDV